MTAPTPPAAELTGPHLARALSRLLGVAPVRGLLGEAHPAWADQLAAFVLDTLESRAAPETDEAARSEARTLLEAMGRAGILAPIGSRDLRGGCLAREAVAFASPLADAVWALQGLGITPLLDHGTGEQRARWAEPALAGQVMTAFALSEPEAGTDVAALRTRAVAQGDAYVLNGRKWYISNAGIADLYVVFASTEPGAGNRGISAFLVPADTPGFHFVAPQRLSAPHPLGEVAFRECRIPARARLGEEGQGFKIAMATLDRLRPTVGAAACGMAARALAEAARHARVRTQFGSPLSGFQMVQAKLGKGAVELEAARLLVYRAAWEADQGAERITTEAAMAKAFATEAAQGIIDDAVQIHGGRGVLAESRVDHLYRSVRALRIYEGTTEIQHLIVARRLLDDLELEEGAPGEGGGS